MFKRVQRPRAWETNLFCYDSDFIGSASKNVRFILQPERLDPIRDTGVECRGTKLFQNAGCRAVVFPVIL